MSFLAFSGKTCLFFLRSCSSCTLSISLAAESTEEVKEHGTKEFSTWPSSLSFDFETFCYIHIFSRSDSHVISILWKKLNKENKTPSRRTDLCNAVVSWLFQNIQIREKIECFLSEASFLDLLLSKLNQSIFVISDDGEHVRIKLQNIRIIKMK